MSSDPEETMSASQYMHGFQKDLLWHHMGIMKGLVPTGEHWYPNHISDVIIMNSRLIVIMYVHAYMLHVYTKLACFDKLCDNAWELVFVFLKTEGDCVREYV